MANLGATQLWNQKLSTSALTRVISLFATVSMQQLSIAFEGLSPFFRRGLGEPSTRAIGFLGTQPTSRDAENRSPWHARSSAAKDDLLFDFLLPVPVFPVPPPLPIKAALDAIRPFKRDFNRRSSRTKDKPTRLKLSRPTNGSTKMWAASPSTAPFPWAPDLRTDPSPSSSPPPLLFGLAASGSEALPFKAAIRGRGGLPGTAYLEGDVLRGVEIREGEGRGGAFAFSNLEVVDGGGATVTDKLLKISVT
mmetsp:Transcript_20153/g.36211  ORF Transcript_20153/g.36211 Transcript_20153/m.36211 type:complete len:250 (+) Transcript_20153:1408-2157(+)